nr:monodehydroascorbate reductase [Tanacetum cinerariifolium]
MIQPEPEGSTQGYPQDSVEVLKNSKVKVGHTNVNESVKKALLKSWAIDCFEKALDPDKDPMERRFDDYKWEFDLEIEQLADEYELGIGKIGHILDMIWENFKNIQGKAKEWCIAGGLDHVNLVIRLPLEHGISRVLEKVDYPNPSVGTNQVTDSITRFEIAGIIRQTKDIYSAVHIQQFWKTVKQVLNHNETICFMVNNEEITYTMDMFRATLKLPFRRLQVHVTPCLKLLSMFRATLKLPVETPKQPFIPTTVFDYIKPFIRILGYQGSLDKVSAFFTKNLTQPWRTMFKVFNRCLTSRLTGYGQTKINVLQIFHVVIKKVHVDYRSTSQFPRDLKRATIPSKMILRCQNRLNLPKERIGNLEPLGHRTLKKKKKKEKQVAEETSSPRKSLKLVEREEEEFDGTEFVDTILLNDEDLSDRTRVSGSSKIRKEKIQTSIPSPPRSLRNDLSLDKDITQELTVFVSPTPATSSQDRSKPISRRYTHIQGAIKRIYKALKDIVPKLATKVTNDLIIDNLPRIVTNVVKKESLHKLS